MLGHLFLSVQLTSVPQGREVVRLSPMATRERRFFVAQHQKRLTNCKILQVKRKVPIERDGPPGLQIWALRRDEGYECLWKCPAGCVLFVPAARERARGFPRVFAVK